MNTKLKHVQNWLFLAKKANWSVSTLAGLCGITTRTLQRHFAERLGTTPKAWMAEQRKRLALELLRHGYSVKETSARIGFRHASHLSRALREADRAADHQGNDSGWTEERRTVSRFAR